MKRIALSMLATMFICASSLQNHNLSNMLCTKNPWEFVEDEFIIKPQQQIDAINAFYNKVIILFVIYQLHKEMSSWFKISKKTSSTPPKSSLKFVFEMAWQMFGFQMIELCIKKIVNFHTLRNFILAWPDDKEDIPKELHEFFDKLSKEFEFRGNYRLQSLTPDMLHKIRHVIWEHFSKKYEHKLKPE